MGDVRPALVNVSLLRDFCLPRVPAWQVQGEHSTRGHHGVYEGPLCHNSTLKVDVALGG